ncbi:MAG: hypothetical protein ABL982_04190 [Vicinamibacterales bacterium]
MTNERATELIYAALTDINAERGSAPGVALAAQTALLGNAGVLDSLELVSFIANLEGRLSEELAKPVLIVNEEAFDGHVFRDVASLAAHLVRLDA